MKSSIHPDYKAVAVRCSCGHEFTINSTLGREELAIEVCPKCHPFYTGQQRIVDTQGRVERYRKRFSGRSLTASTKKAS